MDSRRVSEWVLGIGGIILTGWNRNTARKIGLSAILSAINPTCIGLGSKLVLCSDIRATSRLSHVTVSVHTCGTWYITLSSALQTVGPHTLSLWSPLVNSTFLLLRHIVMVWSLLIRELAWVTGGRHFVALRYVCTLFEDSCHRKRIAVLLATEHRCNTVEPLFNEESVTCIQRCNLCTDGAPAMFGACKGDGNFILSSVWGIVGFRMLS